MATPKIVFEVDAFQKMTQELACKMQAVTEPYRQMQEAIAKSCEPYQIIQRSLQRAFEPYQQIQESLQNSLCKLTDPFLAQQRAMEKIQKSLLPAFDTHKYFAEKIAASLLPTTCIQKQMASLVIQITSAKDDAIARAVQDLSEQVIDYEPGVDDSDAYILDEVSRLITQGDVLSSPAKWPALSKPAKAVLLWLLSGLILTISVNWIAYGQIPFSHIRHQQKVSVRQAREDVKGHMQEQERRPFVTMDGLSVHGNSNRRSRVLDNLPFGTEVTILEFRSKKRWLLVEWQDGDAICRGWVFGRYIFRPSKYRRQVR